MERVDAVQKPPLVFIVVLTVMVVFASEVFTRFTASSVAQANQVNWLIDRSAGVTAYELLALSVTIGLSMTLRLWDRFGLRKWAKQLHQYTTLLVLPFIALHLFGLLRDTSVPFSVVNLLIPGTSGYRPFLTALGSLSLYGVLILILSSYLRDHMSAKVWRIIHVLAFPTFFAVTVHGFGIGTDSQTLLGYFLYGVPLLVVLYLSFVRVQDVTSEKRATAR